MRRLLLALFVIGTLAAASVVMTGPASGIPGLFNDDDSTTEESGAVDMKDVNFGNYLTECPQAGLRDRTPQPLDRRQRDEVEQRSQGGDDVRANQDYACFPQNETALDQNPLTARNLVGGANDYRLGFGTSGFYATTDNGQHWYDGIIPFPSLPNGDNLDGGGDPAIVYDRSGTVFYADINFNRTDDTNGVWVSRSTNGGFTWSRPCVAFTPDEAATEAEAVCGGPGDPRQPGDGTVVYNEDLGTGLTPGHDKEWITAGPRPAGVQPTCYTPLTRTPRACDQAVVGPDRLYVTWTVFKAARVGTRILTVASQIFESHSDDQARSWSPPKVINGSSQVCTGAFAGGSACDDDQGSQPTVNPTTGQLWVGFLNGDTQDEDQYLVVTSRDGGQTFSPPSRVDTIYDVNEPRGRNGRADCIDRGQDAGRVVLTNTCFRADPIMHSIVADKRGDSFSDDLYVVLWDNRNGTIRNSNNDVFFYKSTDGGLTWIGPTRVNDDPSATPANRDCGRTPNSTQGNATLCPATNTGADQFFPWLTISQGGTLAVTFHDRRLDQTNAPAGAWPTSRTEDGNYLVWYWGASCRITHTQTVSQTTGGPVPSGAAQCVAPEAQVLPRPTGPVNPGVGPVPGNGQNVETLPFRNFQISQTPSNFDYAFRAGIFAGDYSGNTSGPINPAGSRGGDSNGSERVSALWTDARNGRGSGAPTSFQPGRNPICEQSDVFFDSFVPGARGNDRGRGDAGEQNAFLVTPCPGAAKDHRDGNFSENDRRGDRRR